MVSDPVWSKQAERLNRRRLLGGFVSAGIGLGAVSIVGCGDDDDSTTPATQQTGGSSTASATATESVKKGGTWNAAQGADVPALDPYSTPSAITKGAAAYVYSRLFVVEPAKPDANGAVPIKLVGDLAQGYQAAADGKKYTVTLKPNAKWHPPISRPVTADDIVYSWQRFTGKLPGSKAAAAANRLDVIDSVRAVDEKTVEFNLTRTYGPFLELLADANLLLIMPKETGTAFDPAQAMVGSGPFIFEKFQPGSVISYKRNPEWHGGPDRPYLDRIVINIIKEPATQLNQFLGGNLDTLGINGIDAASVKSKIPGVQFVLRDTAGLVGYIAFSQLSNKRANAPWTDERVRQAMSMAINRDELLDITYNIGKLKDQGIDVPRLWAGLLPASLGSMTVNPKSDPNIEKYFKFDPKAAKQLLDSAGGGFSTSMQYAKVIGAEYATIAETLPKYWSDIGIKVDLEIVDYAAGFVPKTLRGDFPGLAMAGYAGIPDPGQFLESAFSSTSPTNQDKLNDPQADQYLLKYSSEPDAEKRKATLVEFQKYLLPKMYYIPSQWGAALSITGFQPNVRGPKDYASYGYGAQAVEIPYFWKA